jgi:hypothetical protein
MTKPVSPKPLIVAATTCALILAIGFASPTAAVSSAHRGTQPDAGRTTGMRGPCLGGGKISVIVSQPSGGGLLVHVATSGLRDDSVWRGTMFIDDLDGVAAPLGYIVYPIRAVGGGFVIDAEFDPLSRFSVSLGIGSHPDEKCLAVVDSTTRAVARCHGGLRISISAVQHRNPDRLDFVARLHGAHPGSEWNNETSIRSKPVTESSSGGGYRASGDGVVEARLSWVGIVIANRAFATTFDGPAGQRCSLQLGTHRLVAA